MSDEEKVEAVQEKPEDAVHEEEMNTEEVYESISQVPEIEPELKDGKEVIPGVIYISSIPRGMGPIHVRQFMQIFGEIGRIYLAPRDKKAIKKNTHRYAVDDYSEGWVEFKKKKHAKIAAGHLNAQPIEQTKKKSKFAGIMWNIKYLHKTRWHHLTEQLVYEEQSRKQKMRTEIAQAKRETEVFVKNIEASKKQTAIVERKRKAGIEMNLKKSNKFETKQRKVITKAKKKSVLAQNLFG